jgi:hypothetical protein
MPTSTPVGNWTVVLDEIIERLDLCIDVDQLRSRTGYKVAHDYLGTLIESECNEARREGELERSPYGF